MEANVSRAPSDISYVQVKNTILRAGAGAGKTTTLIRLFEERALAFKKENGRFPRMVLTTFTRKATQEIRERLLAEALKKDLPDLFRYINSRSRVHISTIHGVLSLYLTQYGKDLGLAPEFKLIDAPEVYFRGKRILRNLLLENPQWIDLVESYDINILLSILNQYYQQHFLHENSYPVSKSKLNKMSDQILLRLVLKGSNFYEQISAFELSDSWKSYLQKFEILRDLKSPTWDIFSTFIEGLGRKPPFSSKKPPFDEDLHGQFDSYIKDCKAWIQQEGCQESFQERHHQVSEKFEALAKEFCARNLKERLSSSLLSMSDLEGLALKLIRTSPWTAEKFAAQWDYWMIDEYQDTSPLQVELLKHLVGNSAHYVVGDPQQSIYLFRGARSDVFHAKVEQIKNTQGDVQTSLTNYRSQASLLNFINAYFEPKNSFAAMIPFRADSSDKYCCDIIILEKNSEQKNSEERAILSLIEEKMKNGALAQEICVLARTNKSLKVVAQMALEYKIPVQLYSAGGFSERREVLDFISILKFLSNPHDNLNLITVLRSPWFHVPDPELIKITQMWKAKDSLWNFWKNYPSSLEINILTKLKYYEGLSRNIGFSETMKNILINQGLIDTAHILDPSGRREANLWKILMDFKMAETSSGFNPLQFIENLNASVEGQEQADATPVIEPERVNLMTIHASKGLQFKHVIIAGFGGDQRKFHGDWWMIDEMTGEWTLSLKSIDQKKISSLSGLEMIRDRQDKEKEESDRLLYVAMTRARETLSFIWTENPRKGSWASEFPFPTTEGSHEKEKFNYQVRRHLPSPHILESSSEIFLDIRAHFQEVSKLSKFTEGSQFSAEEVKISLENSRRGGDLYRLLEAIRYQPHLWDETDHQYAEVLSFLKSFNKIPFDKIISQGETDWRYVIEIKEQRYQGKVDLWFRDGHQVWLIDYRMGTTRDAMKTLKNLETSAWAMKQMGLINDSDQVHLWGLFIFEKESRNKTMSAAELYEPLNVTR